MSTAATAPAAPSGAPAPAAGIQLEHLDLVYRTDAGQDVLALDGIDLDVPGGQFVSIVGPSGCGKTTLLRIVAGFLSPTRGRALLDGQPIERPHRDVGVVFQRPPLFPWLTVRRNIELGLRYRGVPRSQRTAVSDTYLERVGLTEFADAKPYELSGGMQQRCQIARVLANEPRVILMDEPFGALDALTRARLQGDLQTLHREQASTVLFITHSVDEAVLLGQRVLVLSPRPGRIVLDTPIHLAARDDARGGTADGTRGHTAEIIGEGTGELTSDPEFIAQRDAVAAAIQHS